MSYSSEVLADAPLLYWKLDESSGAVTDSSGNGRGGTIAGGVTRGQTSLLGDGSGAAALFTGGYATVGYGAWIETPNLTVEARFKPDANALTSTKPIVSAWVNSGNARWILWCNAGKLEAYIYTSTNTNRNILGSTTLVAGTTYTVGFTYDGSTIRVYLNGVQEAASSTAAFPISTTGSLMPFEVARVSQASLGSGTIDEVSFTGTALSAARMATRHAAAIATGGPTPVTGTLAGSLPALSSSLAGTSTPPAYTGTLAATLPSLSTALAGGSTPPGAAGPLAITLPSLATQVTGAYTDPTYAGTLATTLPSLTAGVSGTVAGGSASTYATEVLADTPLAYYRMGEASGTTLVDSSGNGRNGTYNAAPTYGQPGLVGDTDTAVAFNGGTTQWASVPNAAWMNFSGGFTVEAVISKAADGNYDLVGTDSFEFMTEAAGSVYCWMTSEVSGGSGGTAGVPTHLAVTFDNGTILAYINGVQVASTAMTGPMPNPTTDLLIGSFPSLTTYDYNGVLDEVAIYGHALTADRVAAHAAAAGLATAPAALPTVMNWESQDDAAYLATSGTLDAGADLAPQPLRTLAQSIEPPVFDMATGAPQAGWGDARATFYDTWATSLHLVIDGVDVTRFRGAPVEIVQWPLISQEPFAYGSGAFRFPRVNQLEIRSSKADMPRGLRWLRKHARAHLVPVVAGVRQAPIWRGVLTRYGFQDGTVVGYFDGDLVSPLSADQRQPIVFHRRKDAGVYLFDAVSGANRRMTPHLGATTGIPLDNRGSGETQLEYAQSLLADTVGTDGSQYTILRATDDKSYRMKVKDTTTVHYTVFAGTQGVDLSGLVRDTQEEYNTLYGSGQDPDGRIWLHAVAPGLGSQGTPPAYPIAAGTSFGTGTTNADFDAPADDMLSAMLWKLVGTGYLKRKDIPGGYDSDVSDAIKGLQADAELTQSGTMNPATWDALYDVNVTGYSLLQAQVTPLVQNSNVKKWLRTANGDLKKRNPAFDPTAQVVARTVQHGVLDEDRAVKWSKGEIARSNGANWAGSIGLDRVDVFAGDYHHGDPTPTLVSRFQIQAGKNLMVRGFDGDTLFHLAGNQPGSWDATTLTADTQARDRKTIAEVVARNRDSRRNRGRVWRHENAPSRQVRDGRIPFWEKAGLVDTPIHFTGGKWNTFFVVAGDEGTIGKLRMHVATSAFYVAVFAQKVTVQWLQKHIGDPSVVDADGNPVWMKASVQARLFDQRTLLYAEGTAEEPCGYDPRTHQKADGSGVTDAPVTGVFSDDSGFPFHAYGQPLLWVGVYPLNDSVLRPGRIMWDQLASM